MAGTGPCCPTEILRKAEALWERELTTDFVWIHRHGQTNVWRTDPSISCHLPAHHYRSPVISTDSLFSHLHFFPSRTEHNFVRYSAAMLNLSSFTKLIFVTTATFYISFLLFLWTFSSANFVLFFWLFLCDRSLASLLSQTPDQGLRVLNTELFLLCSCTPCATSLLVVLLNSNSLFPFPPGNDGAASPSWHNMGNITITSFFFPLLHPRSPFSW